MKEKKKGKVFAKFTQHADSRNEPT